MSDRVGEGPSSSGEASTSTAVAGGASASSGGGAASVADGDGWTTVKTRKEGRGRLRSREIRFGESTLVLEETRDRTKAGWRKGLKLTAITGERTSYIRVPATIGSEFSAQLGLLLTSNGKETRSREVWEGDSQYLLTIVTGRRPFCKLVKMRAGKILARIHIPSFSWTDVLDGLGTIGFRVAGPNRTVSQELQRSPAPEKVTGAPATSPENFSNHFSSNFLAFSKAWWDIGAKEVEKSLVLENSSGPSEFLSLSKELQQNWGLPSAPKVSFLAPNRWLVWLNQEVDLKTFMASVAVVGYKIWTLNDWRSSDRDRWAWVRIYGLPIELWRTVTFEAIGQALGRLVQVDQSTLASHRLDFARMLIKGRRPTLKDQVITIKVGEHSFEVVASWEDENVEEVPLEVDDKETSLESSFNKPSNASTPPLYKEILTGPSLKSPTPSPQTPIPSIAPSPAQPTHTHTPAPSPQTPIPPLTYSPAPSPSAQPIHTHPSAPPPSSQPSTTYQRRKTDTLSSSSRSPDREKNMNNNGSTSGPIDKTARRSSTGRERASANTPDFLRSGPRIRGRIPAENLSYGTPFTTDSWLELVEDQKGRYKEEELQKMRELAKLMDEVARKNKEIGGSSSLS